MKSSSWSTSNPPNLPTKSESEASDAEWSSLVGIETNTPRFWLAPARLKLARAPEADRLLADGRA